MRIFQKASIKQKLIWISLVTTGVALLLTSVVLIANELISFRRSLVDSLTIQAKMICSNSTAALAFNNHKDAEDPWCAKCRS